MYVNKKIQTGWSFFLSFIIKHDYHENKGNSMIEKQSTRDRLIHISQVLFLKQGYGNTGLNQIVAEAKTVKASLYQHFKSKEELGKVVLKKYSSENLTLLSELMIKYPKPLDFVDAWMRILKREARRNQVFGCPMANVRSQISDSSPEILKSIQEISKETIDRMEKYIVQAQQLGYVKKILDPKQSARHMFLSYEGVLQLWRLTGDLKSLDELHEIVTKILPN
jgi:AcrR family transcriptional regulator